MFSPPLSDLTIEGHPHSSTASRKSEKTVLPGYRVMHADRIFYVYVNAFKTSPHHNNAIL